MNRYPIKKYMKGSLSTIGEDLPLSEANTMMRENHIRHLPVLSRGKLVGILSDRDVRLAAMVHPKVTELKVSDIMTEDAYAVPDTCGLDEVTKQMAERKLGCAIVVDPENHPVGIFSVVDALSLLSEFLRKKKLARIDADNRSSSTGDTAWTSNGQRTYGEDW